MGQINGAIAALLYGCRRLWFCVQLLWAYTVLFTSSGTCINHNRLQCYDSVGVALLCDVLELRLSANCRLILNSYMLPLHFEIMWLFISKYSELERNWNQPQSNRTLRHPVVARCRLARITLFFSLQTNRCLRHTHAPLFIPHPDGWLSHTLTPFCSVCLQFFGFITGSVNITSFRSRLTMSIQFFLGRPDFLLYPLSSHCRPGL